MKDEIARDIARQLKRIADALAGTNDASFGDGVNKRSASFFGPISSTLDGEGDYLLDPYADRTGEDTE